MFVSSDANKIAALLGKKGRAILEDAAFGLRPRRGVKQPHGECRTGWTELQDGLDYRTINCLGDEDDLHLHVVRVNIDPWKVDAAITDRATGRMIARDRDASFAINANFFDRARNPIGAVVRSGSVVHDPHASSWKKYRETAEMAVQAGPRLVIGGHTNKSIRNNYAAARAGVCIQRDGDVLLARRDEADGGATDQVGRVSMKVR